VRREGESARSEVGGRRRRRSPWFGCSIGTSTRGSTGRGGAPPRPAAG